MEPEKLLELQLISRVQELVPMKKMDAMESRLYGDGFFPSTRSQDLHPNLNEFFNPELITLVLQVGGVFSLKREKAS